MNSISYPIGFQQEPEFTPIPSRAAQIILPSPGMSDAAKRLSSHAARLSSQRNISLGQERKVSYLGSKPLDETPFQTGSEEFKRVDQLIQSDSFPFDQGDAFQQEIYRQKFDIPKSVDYFGDIIKELKEKAPVDAISDVSATLAVIELIALFTPANTAIIALNAGKGAHFIKLEIEEALKNGNTTVVSYDQETGYPNATFEDNLYTLMGLCEMVAIPCEVAETSITFIASHIKEQLHALGITNEAVIELKNKIFEIANDIINP